MHVSPLLDEQTWQKLLPVLRQERHLIECFFNKIKHYRRVFSRFEKKAKNLLSFVYFTASLIWLR
jgi:transposase